MKVIVRILERFYKYVMSKWPDAREQMDPMTRTEYEARIRKVREQIKRLKVRWCVR